MLPSSPKGKKGGEGEKDRGGDSEREAQREGERRANDTRKLPHPLPKKNNYLEETLTKLCTYEPVAS